MLRLFYAAVAVLVLSWIPLVLVGLADPNSNPIGLGLLGMAGTALAVLLLAASAVVGLAGLMRRR